MDANSFAETLSSVFLYCALVGGGLLLVQFAMMLMGMDDGGFGEMADAGGFEMGDMDADGATDGSGFWLLEMLSLRTLSAAACFFGLVGKASLSADQSPGVSLMLALVAGYAALYAVYWTFKQLFKLETSGNEDIRNAVGLTGQVYIPIQANSIGKIQIKLQGRTVEYQALTDHIERLATGEKVVVTDIVSSDTVKVMPAS